jgi:hypothetical protein
METEEEQLREIKVISERLHPGRAWEGLSPEEQEAVFASYDSMRGMGQDMVASGQDTLAGAGKTVGPYKVYVNNPWESLAGAAQVALGGYQQGKANRQEAKGRKAQADLITRRDAQDRSAENDRAAREEEHRERMLQAIMSRR